MPSWSTAMSPNNPSSPAPASRKPSPKWPPSKNGPSPSYLMCNEARVRTCLSPFLPSCFAFCISSAYSAYSAVVFNAFLLHFFCISSAFLFSVFSVFRVFSGGPNASFFCIPFRVFSGFRGKFTASPSRVFSVFRGRPLPPCDGIVWCASRKIIRKIFAKIISDSYPNSLTLVLPNTILGKSYFKLFET